MFVASDGADIVLASHHDGGELANVSRHRRFLSKAASSAIRRGAGLDASTVSSFFRVYRASILREGYAEHGDALIRERGFACKAELLIKLSRLGARVAEVPVTLDWANRQGESKMRVLPTMAGYARMMTRQVASPQRLCVSVGIVGGGLLGLGIAHELAQAGVDGRGLRGRQAPGRARRLDADRRRAPSTATTTRSPPTTTRSSRWPSTLGLSIRWRPLGVGFFHDGRRCSMSTPRRGPDVPGPADRRQGAPRRVRARLRPHLGPRGARRDQPIEEWARKTAATGSGSTCGRRCWTPSSTAATTTCPATYLWSRMRRTAGTRDPRAGARSWARSRAATRRWSTGSRSASAASAARSTLHRRSATSRPRPPAARWAS